LATETTLKMTLPVVPEVIQISAPGATLLISPVE
jgi:hypothetical protein